MLHDDEATGILRTVRWFLTGWVAMATDSRRCKRVRRSLLHKKIQCLIKYHTSLLMPERMGVPERGGPSSVWSAISGFRWTWLNLYILLYRSVDARAFVP